MSPRSTRGHRDPGTPATPGTFPRACRAPEQSWGGHVPQSQLPLPPASLAMGGEAALWGGQGERSPASRHCWDHGRAPNPRAGWGLDAPTGSQPRPCSRLPGGPRVHPPCGQWAACGRERASLSRPPAPCRPQRSRAGLGSNDLRKVWSWLLFREEKVPFALEGLRLAGTVARREAPQEAQTLRVSGLSEGGSPTPSTAKLRAGVEVGRGLGPPEPWVCRRKAEGSGRESPQPPPASPGSPWAVRPAGPGPALGTGRPPLPQRFPQLWVPMGVPSLQRRLVGEDPTPVGLLSGKACSGRRGADPAGRPPATWTPRRCLPAAP